MKILDLKWCNIHWTLDWNYLTTNYSASNPTLYMISPYANHTIDLFLLKCSRKNPRKIHQKIILWNPITPIFPNEFSKVKYIEQSKIILALKEVSFIFLRTAFAEIWCFQKIIPESFYGILGESCLECIKCSNIWK